MMLSTKCNVSIGALLCVLYLCGSAPAVAGVVCLDQSRITPEPEGAALSECTLAVDGLPQDLMYASVSLQLSGTAGSFIAVGVRVGDKVLITDQTCLTESPRNVVLDVSEAAKYVVDNRIGTLALVIGPGLLGDAGTFRLEQLGGYWGQVDYIGQPTARAVAKRRLAGQVDAKLRESGQPEADRVDVRVSPNPANPKTSFYLSVGRDSSVNLSIYDVRGRLVARSTRYGTGGTQLVFEWDGLDQSGQAVPSGVYLYRVEANDAPIGNGKVSIVR